jgi:uncharacterized membrane protein
MDSGFTSLAAAALLFLLTHVGLSGSRLRPALAGRIGEGGFLVLYSLVALGIIAWMVLAYRAAPMVTLWSAGEGLRSLPFALMPIVFVLLVSGLTTRNPTGVGQEAAATAPVRGILRITRHPVQWAILLWATLHVIANGDLASLIFFGAFAVLAAAGGVLIDAKKRARLGSNWETFARGTSNVPFAAIAQGRNRVSFYEVGPWRVLGGLLLFAILVAAHPYLFGVSAM